MHGKKTSRRQFFKRLAIGGGLFFIAKPRRSAVAATETAGGKRLSDDPRILSNLNEIETLVIGSGYGGAITAARLAESGKAVVVFERGLEWKPGDFPRTPLQAAATLFLPSRPKLNPLGLFRFCIGRGVSVLSGAGLGGTSLINAGVALRPPREIFSDRNWPSDITYESLEVYFARAEQTLGAKVTPAGLEHFPKIQTQLTAAHANKLKVEKVPLAVDFKKCTACGDCMSGCNVGAKNTLDRNYLAQAKAKGARIFTQTRVTHFAKHPDGYEVFYEYVDRSGKVAFSGNLRTKNLVLAAGTMGSTELLLRSQARGGIRCSARLGEQFSTNGDVIAMSYNGEVRTEIVGIGQRPRRKNQIGDPGPSVITKIEVPVDGESPFVVEDLSMPSLMGELLRKPMALLYLARGGNPQSAIGRALLDLLPARDSNGALGHAIVSVALGKDTARGRIELDARDYARVSWPGASQTDPGLVLVTQRLRSFFGQTGVFRTFTAWLNGDGKFKKFLGDNAISGHPLGGCAMGEDITRGVVDSRGRVFDPQGGVHAGLYVCDGSIVPVALGVNPFLTIAALAEKNVEYLLD